ncbi:MAG: pyridoxal phosphate-dependent aminotransferase [Janthinobacterium lividum]
MKLSQRVLSAKPSATKEVTCLARVLADQGRDIIALSQGEPDFDTPLHIRDAAKRALDEGQTRYTDVAGTLALREAICRKLLRDHGMTVSPDCVQVGTGAKQVLYNALQATLDAGDEVVVPAPCWVSYPEMVTLAGGTPVVVPCGPDVGFKLSPGTLEEALTTRTRWVMLNSPSNPTGAVCSAAELDALVAVLERHPHAMLMADDVYEKLRYAPGAFATPAAVAPAFADRVLTVNGVSKAFAMTGWRIGWGSGPAPLIKAMNSIQSQSTSHACSIAQAASVAALDGPMDFLPGFLDAYRRRRDLLVSGLNSVPGVSCDMPEGAFYAFPSVAGLLGRRTPGGAALADDLSVAAWLLEEAGLAVVPGTAFLLPGHLRFSYAASDTVIAEAIQRFATAANSLH